MTSDELVTANLGLAYWVADGYYLPGADRADVRQEAALALMEAAEAFNPNQGHFRTFAVQVIRRRLIDRINFEQRRPALNKSVRDDEMLERIAAPDDLDDLVEHRLELQRIRRLLVTLTDLERKFLGQSLRGEPYWETAQGDNAAQRARRKLREAA